MRLVLLTAIVAMFGCSKKEDAGSAPGKATPAASGVAPSASAPAAPAMKPPDPVAAEGRVDICSWVTLDQVSAAVGKVTRPGSPSSVGGGRLGGCSWYYDSGTATATARKAGEYSGTVSASGSTTDVPGLGKRAASTKDAGVMVELDGKPYFLDFIVTSPAGINAEKSLALAKVIVANAK